MSNNIIIKSDISIAASVRTVWGWFFDPDNLLRLVDFPIGADLKAAGGGYTGTVTMNKIRFSANIFPHDITLESGGNIFGIRLSDTPRGCKVIMAASTPHGKRPLFEHDCICKTLARLKELIEQKPENSFSCEDDLSNYSAYSDERQTDCEPESREFARREKTSKKSGRVLSALLLLFLFTGVVFAGIKFIPGMLAARNASGKAAQDAADLSSSVTMSSALSIAPGMSEGEIKNILKTDGIKDGTGIIYRSATLDGASRPVVQVKVEYASGKAVKITTLDLARANEVGTVALQSIPAAYGDTLDAVEESLGTSLSMSRRYLDESGGLVDEYHFGYIDPYANFSPAWRGELIVTMSETGGGCAVKNWVGYDGSDPLMINELDGHPAASQYTNYDEFLNDKFSYDYSLLMLNRYSQGDIRAVFGEYTTYDGGGGLAFNYIDSADTLTLSDGAECPVWRMSFGLNSRGQFVVGSYVNMSLLTREGCLALCKPASVAKGMTYSEVREYMAVLPTALYVNEGGYTICYGKLLDKETASEQFEFVVNFGNNNRVNGIYDNTGMNASGSITTNDPDAKTD